MRITNAMVVNTMLLNLNKTQNYMNDLYQQQTSTKKIQVPSDNPILAARALKFRTNVTQTQQYKSNVAQGLSWMEATETSLINIEGITNDIRKLFESGANATNTAEDRQKLVTSIEQFMAAINDEMNRTYAGRYVFSGFRTNESPILTADNKDRYNIYQTFSSGDVETIKMYQKIKDSVYGNVNEPVIKENVKVLKLAYTDVKNLDIGYMDDTADPPFTSYGYTITEKSLDDPLDLDALAADEVIYIRETGELILGSDVAAAINTQNFTINYDKTGFSAGDLNPKVYFTCEDRTDPDPQNYLSYNMDNQVIEYEFSVGTRISVNLLGKDIYTDKFYADLRDFCTYVKNMGNSDTDQLQAMFREKNPQASDEEIDTMVNEQIAHENQLIQDALNDRFRTMMGIMDRNKTNLATQNADIGTRMNRLLLIETRLSEDEINYEKLRSDNEDAELSEVVTKLALAEAAFNAALSAGAKIMQLTLADYIR